jgi:hypothetical protein
MKLNQSIMKKKSTFLIAALVSLFSITATAGDYGNGNLYDIVNNAVDGEVINLTGDTYTFNPRITTLSKSLTIQSGSGVTVRPIITVGQAGVQFIATGSSAQTLTLKGLEFNGSAIATGLTQGKNTTGGNFTVTIDNCKTSNFANGTAMFFYTALSGLSVYGDLTVTNSEFTGPNPLSLLNTTATNTSPNNIIFSNCLIKGFNTANNTILITATTALAGITIDHCTFQNGPTSSRRPLVLPAGTPQEVKNCIFVDQPGTGNNVIAANAANDKNVVFNGGLASRWLNFGTLLTSDPLVGVNGVTLESTYYNAGTDDKTIGFYGAPGLGATVLEAIKANNFTVTQSGTNFTVKGISDTAYTVYQLNGIQVSKGILKGGIFHFSANKGIYLLKANGQVVKFYLN